jgi:hypothetical protein
VTGIVPEGVPLIVVLGIALVAPLFLHVVTAAIAAIGASRSRAHYSIALSVAIVVHLAYNLTVVSLIAQ